MSNICQIVITSKKHGKFTVLFDKEYQSEILKHRWFLKAGQSHRNNFYPYTVLKRFTKEDGTKTQINLLMHRLIYPKGMIDHIDGNGLNNCKSNLRPCSYAGNARNKSISKNNKSGYKGVIITRGFSYRAEITYNRKNINLGTFKVKEEAALAYNQAALKYFGEFAKLNPL